jgi:hypothetical protein
VQLDEIAHFDMQIAGQANVGKPELTPDGPDIGNRQRIGIEEQRGIETVLVDLGLVVAGTKPQSAKWDSDDFTIQMIELPAVRGSERPNRT